MGGRNKDISAAGKPVPLTAGATVIPLTRGLLVGTGGTATITDADGVSRVDVPLQTGYNPLQITALTALGTASNVWALY